MYELLILLSAKSSASIEKLEAAVRAEFSTSKTQQPVSTSVQNGKLVVLVGEFHFFVQLACGAEVLEESREIAEQFAALHPSRKAIAEASCRFELMSDEDPMMDRFNDLIFMCQAAERLGSVYIFNPHARRFL